MTTKFTLDIVKQIIGSEGYTLVSEKYINSGTKINLLCPKHHPWSTTLNDFTSQGSRCPTCLGKPIYTTEMVRNILSKEGYKLVSTKYNNMKERLEMVCPNNHTCFLTLWAFMKTKSRCLPCSGINRYSTEEISEILKKEGFILISKNYKNAQQKLEVICSKGHKIAIRMNGFLSQGSRCKHCAPNRPHSIESIRSFVEERGYKLITEEYSPNEKISLVCPNGHSYNTSTFYNFKKGRKCPECTNKGSSENEKEILNWIKQFYPSATKEKKYYDQTNGKKYLELDVYIPEIKLAIEYDGLIWHCEKFKKNNAFHYDKTQLAKKLGLRMIHIFSDEWRDRKDQIKNYLLSVINKNPINIGARKTELKIINKKDAKKFLDENHIQGAATIDVAFGLYFNGELIATMTGNEHHRQGQENIFVLNRLAFKSNVSVQGGSSRLLKALISYAKEKGYSKLISWSDNRWSEGRVYEKMGFTLEEEIKPDYSYVKRESRFSKQSNTKKNLLKKGAKGTMANTEKELALSLGLYRIYDCGKKRWVMDLSK